MEYQAIPQDEYISHYGVMGMRWGCRKDGGPQGYLGTYPKGDMKKAGNISKKDPIYGSKEYREKYEKLKEPLQIMTKSYLNGK